MSYKTKAAVLSLVVVTMFLVVLGVGCYFEYKMSDGVGLVLPSASLLFVNLIYFGVEAVSSAAHLNLNRNTKLYAGMALLADIMTASWLAASGRGDTDTMVLLCLLCLAVYFYTRIWGNDKNAVMDTRMACYAGLVSTAILAGMVLKVDFNPDIILVPAVLCAIYFYDMLYSCIRKLPTE